MTRPIRICPSILSADLSKLRDNISLVESGGADWIHVDVMDGHFVPNLTFGEPIISALRSLTDLPLDVHLMVEAPERYIEPFAVAGASVFTFHPEATVHIQRHLSTVREYGMRAGLALNPSTPISVVEEIAPELDLLLIMSVNPGFGGQTYWSGSAEKIKRARQLLDAAGSRAALEVDGGVNRQTIVEAFRAGADTFVAGTAVFGALDIAEEIRELRRRCVPST